MAEKYFPGLTLQKPNPVEQMEQSDFIIISKKPIIREPHIPAKKILTINLDDIIPPDVEDPWTPEQMILDFTKQLSQIDQKNRLSSINDE